MKVRATNQGWYDRGVGLPMKKKNDEFELADEAHFSKRWMERVDGDAPEDAEVIGESGDDGAEPDDTPDEEPKPRRRRGARVAG